MIYPRTVVKELPNSKRGLTNRRGSLQGALVSVSLMMVAIMATVWMTLGCSAISKRVLPTDDCFPGLGQELASVKPAEGGYFPDAAFHQDRRSNQFITDWYTRYLSQMKEPSLIVSPLNQQSSYRFLWVRSFHPTIVVRLSNSDGKYLLSLTELANKTESSQPLVAQNKILKGEEWKGFVKLLNDSCYWRVPTTTTAPVAMDGAWWVLEGVEQGYYHVVVRQSPDTGSYRELCLYMLKLSGLSVDKEKGEIY